MDAGGAVGLFALRLQACLRRRERYVTGPSVPLRYGKGPPERSGPVVPEWRSGPC